MGELNFATKEVLASPGTVDRGGVKISLSMNNLSVESFIRPTICNRNAEDSITKTIHVHHDVISQDGTVN